MLRYLPPEQVLDALRFSSCLPDDQLPLQLSILCKISQDSYHVQRKSVYLLTKQPVAFRPMENISNDPSPDLHPAKVMLVECYVMHYITVLWNVIKMVCYAPS